MSSSQSSERRVPRISHEGGDYIEIGFEGENSTLLKIGGQHGPSGYKDIDRAHDWALAVARLIKREYGGS